MNTRIKEINPKNIQEHDPKEISKEISNGKIIILDIKTNCKIITSLENNETIKEIQSLIEEQKKEDQKLTILISNYRQLQEIAEYIPNEIFRIMNAFWPGPLTIILKPSQEFYNKTKIKEQIQISMPKNNIFKSIIDQTGPLILLTKQENSKDTKSKNNKYTNKIKSLENKVKYIIKINKIDKPTIINGIEKPYKIIEEGQIKENEIKQYLKNIINIKQNKPEKGDING